MKKVFTVGSGFEVPDGTYVHSILDPLVMCGAAEAPQENLSLALGVIPPSTDSRIHLHPLVSQVTWVVEGNLAVKMKEPSIDKPYLLELQQHEAVLTKAGTFFQLINRGSVPCQTLYVVTPAFIFVTDKNGQVIYNDAIVFGESWEELAGNGWPIPESDDLESRLAQRNLAIRHATTPKDSH